MASGIIWLFIGTMVFVCITAIRVSVRPMAAQTKFKDSQLDTLCVRKSDGLIFRPSCPDTYTVGDVYRDMLNGGGQYFFREVVFHSSRIPFKSGRWVQTGYTWSPARHEFDWYDIADSKVAELKETIS